MERIAPEEARGSLPIARCGAESEVETRRFLMSESLLTSGMAGLRLLALRALGALLRRGARPLPRTGLRRHRRRSAE